MSVTTANNVATRLRFILGPPLRAHQTLTGTVPTLLYHTRERNCEPLFDCFPAEDRRETGNGSKARGNDSRHARQERIVILEHWTNLKLPVSGKNEISLIDGNE